MAVYVMVTGYAAQHLNAQAKQRRIPVPILCYDPKPNGYFFWRRPMFGLVATLYAVTEYHEEEITHLHEDELRELCEQAGEPL